MSSSELLPPSGDTRTGRLAYLPISLYGSVMGLSGLALAWRLAAKNFGLPAWIGESIGLIACCIFIALTLCYGIKCVSSPAAVRAEFAHPIAVNFFGTPIIALLLLPAVVAPYSIALTKILWLIGTVSMLSFAWLVVMRWMSVRQQIVHATPAWMIPIVGTLNISIVGVTLDLPGAQAASAFGLAVGLFFAVPLFTLILSRLIFEEPMLPAQRPTLLIFVATFAVSFSAYLSVVGRVDLFASGLFYLAVFMFSVLVPKLLLARSATSFHTSWWAVSFPLAAMSNAALKFDMHHPSWPTQAFALAALAFTTLVILSMGARTVASIARGELRALTQ
jgi:tellurite resistance protein